MAGLRSLPLMLSGCAASQALKRGRDGGHLCGPSITPCLRVRVGYVRCGARTRAAPLRMTDAGVNFGGSVPATVCARPAAGGQPSALRFNARPAGPGPLWCSVSRPIAELTSLASFRYVQTGGDKSVHEARCARGPRALRSSASQRRAAGCPPAAGRGNLQCVQYQTVARERPARGYRAMAML